MSDEGGSSIYGAFASKLGSGAAKAGKKFAQSEAGRSATKAAMKGATDAAVNDISNRYLGPSETTPTPAKPTPAPRSSTTTPTTSATPTSPPPTPTSKDSSDAEYERFQQDSYQWTRPPPKPSLLARFKPNINLKLQSDEKPRPRPRANREKVYKYAAINKADWESLPRAMTLYNFHAQMKCDLEFRKGQIIHVITKTESSNDWWEGRIDDRVGIFPANYIKMM